MLVKRHKKQVNVGKLQILPSDLKEIAFLNVGIIVLLDWNHDVF